MALSGDWTSEFGDTLERAARSLTEGATGGEAGAKGPVVLDLSGIGRLDTAGAVAIERARRAITARGAEPRIEGASRPHARLLDEVSQAGLELPEHTRTSPFVDFLVDVGRVMVDAGRDLVSGIVFLGEVVAALGRVAMRPWRFRGTSLVNQIDQIALRGLPIILLISFVVGAIIAQQGIFQLLQFGAATFAVDLIGILVLRELGVLLSAIMVAGRSGSAFTAEIGAMKMREEIDALRVMGLDPIEVLVVPRILGLVISLPLLAFCASMSAILGGGLVAWAYGGVSPDVFVARLREAIDLSTFMVGMIKAPFMAVMIGVIACIEGLAVKGSAESLGQHVTASVVKAIFMVIVLDGVFAMFFAALDF
ncbi:ABC transporter permease [Salinarimonas ramus]|uniref:ABC transporter permease n=1 Tax=Salinarimonas ramus TaxID=690164 RepID=UPI001FCEB004|nr:MlaE family lipid ABC transporter permease subunit [Salinarimonas ramus]